MVIPPVIWLITSAKPCVVLFIPPPVTAQSHMHNRMVGVALLVDVAILIYRICTTRWIAVELLAVVIIVLYH